MSSQSRGVVAVRLAVVAMTFGIWSFCSGSARAQGMAPTPGVPSPYGGVTYGYEVAAPVPYGLDYGRFYPGYHGFGLEYGFGDRHWTIHRYGVDKNPSGGNWFGYVLGRENLRPYCADPYADPRGAMVPWPPYSAPAGW